tara:strand:+ start:406 stop:666 length:261 start_codon:yes stop_codon:yes gene_type:complete
MDFNLDMEDFTIIQNALHYYKKVEKRGNFQQYNTERINTLRDKLAEQVAPSTIKSTIFSYSSTADTAETYRLKQIREDENISFEYD